MQKILWEEKFECICNRKLIAFEEMVFINVIEISFDINCNKYFNQSFNRNTQYAIIAFKIGTL